MSLHKLPVMTHDFQVQAGPAAVFLWALGKGGASRSEVAQENINCARLHAGTFHALQSPVSARQREARTEERTL